MSKALFIANPSRRRKRRKVSRKSFTSNPRRRRRAKRVSFRRNPAPRRRRGFRRNPSARRLIGRLSAGRGKLNIKDTVMSAGGAALGAIGTDVVFARLPLPANLKTGAMRQLVKAAVGVGLGFLVSRYANKRIGAAIATGGLAIAGYEAARSYLVKEVPALGLGEYLDGLGYYSAGMPVDGLGEYLAGDMAVNPDTGVLTLGGPDEYEGATAMDWNSGLTLGAFSESVDL